MAQIPGISRIFPGSPDFNIPLVSLIAANVITIVLAVIQNWDIATVMFIYWVQSLIIGLFTIISLLTAVASPPITNGDGASIQKPLSPFQEKWGFLFFKYGLAAFFAVHYGFFHYAYYFFIVESGIFGQVNFSSPDLYLACGFFFLNHLYSYRYYRKEPLPGKDTLGEDFVMPYSRIIPMHLTIIFGGIVVLVLQAFGILTTLPVLILFLVLKTYADLDMHLKKHNEMMAEPSAGG
ncbi:MAG: DUF6498-containing protein [Methanoregula sp.]|nr:DUF6498-containing protein [Methanoregula sp.]